MAIPVVEISAAERDKIMALAEGHFADLKDIRIAPSKLTRTLSALSNAEGGEVHRIYQSQQKKPLLGYDATRV